MRREYTTQTQIFKWFGNAAYVHYVKSFIRDSEQLQYLWKESIQTLCPQDSGGTGGGYPSSHHLDTDF